MLLSTAHFSHEIRPMHYLFFYSRSPDFRAKFRSQNKVLSLLLPDLENFLNLPMMRELFGSSAELYTRLTNVLDFEHSLTLEYARYDHIA
jgi:hypothetical protein